MENSRRPWIIVTIIAFILWIGIWLLQSCNIQPPPSLSLKAPPVPPAAVVAAAPKPAAETIVPALAPAPAVVPVVVPNFDGVVRVEPNGATVLAGDAAAGSKVEVLSGAEVVATTTATDSGQWATTLDKPLSPGAHVLTLRATAPGSPVAVLSDEHVVINVPDGGKGGALIVVNKDGAAPRVIEVPDTGVAPAADATVAATAAGASGPAIAGALHIEAVDYDGSVLRLTGTSAVAGTLLAYLDGTKVGSAGIATPGAFALASDKLAVAAGSHTVRVDEVDAGGKVIARAEVPYDRAPDSAAQGPVAGTGAAGGTALPAEAVRLTVKRGDNLWRIAQRIYGKGVRFTTIYQANTSQIRDPNLIYPGQVFLLPDADPHSRWKAGRDATSGR